MCSQANLASFLGSDRNLKKWPTFCRYLCWNGKETQQMFWPSLNLLAFCGLLRWPTQGLVNFGNFFLWSNVIKIFVFACSLMSILKNVNGSLSLCYENGKKQHWRLKCIPWKMYGKCPFLHIFPILHCICKNNSSSTPLAHLSISCMRNRAFLPIYMKHVWSFLCFQMPSWLAEGFTMSRFDLISSD